MNGVAVFLLVICSVPALAQVTVTDAAQKAQNSKTNEELPDSSPGSPPLDTDDPGTPGPSNFEFNFLGTLDSYLGGQARGRGIDLNFGIGERGQFRIQKASILETSPDESDFKGYGPTSLGYKYRFYDDDVSKLATYPAYTLDDEGLHHELDGAEISTSGRFFYLPLILSRQFGAVTVVANAAYSFALDHPESGFSFSSIALGRALTQTFRLMGELTSTGYQDGSTSLWRLGFVYEFYHGQKGDFGLALLGSAGQTFGTTEDRLRHSLALIGLSVSGTFSGQGAKDEPF